MNSSISTRENRFGLSQSTRGLPYPPDKLFQVIPVSTLRFLRVVSSFQRGQEFIYASCSRSTFHGLTILVPGLARQDQKWWGKVLAINKHISIISQRGAGRNGRNLVGALAIMGSYSQYASSNA